MSGTDLKMYKAGYIWKNPITGHNYAYFAFVPGDRQVATDKFNKEMAWEHMGVIFQAITYTLMVRGFKDTLKWLALSVTHTELASAYYNNKLKATLDSDTFKQDTMASPAMVSIIRRDYHGSVEIYQNALRHQLYKFETGATQGSSIVSTSGAGFVLTDFLVNRRWNDIIKRFNKSWWGVITAFWLTGFTASSTYHLGNKLQMAFRTSGPHTGGNYTAHLHHGISAAMGGSLALAWKW